MWACFGQVAVIKVTKKRDCGKEIYHLFLCIKETLVIHQKSKILCPVVSHQNLEINSLIVRVCLSRLEDTAKFINVVKPI